MDIGLFKCSLNERVLDAMKKIDNNARGTLYVVDNNDVLNGCITDGDIRRWIIKGGSVDTPVSSVMNPAPVFVYERNREEFEEILSKKKVLSIAVVDSDKHVIDVLFADRKKSYERNNSLSQTPVIIMAGGKGTRLYPYTKILPKPLIPVGEIPIIERIMNRFSQYGVERFYISVNYRKEMIKSYFAESNKEFDIQYIEEDKPLGTAGSIRLIKDNISEPVIVTNCDILIEADYGEVLAYHKEHGNDMTIVSSLKTMVIPYGVFQSGKNGRIISMEEKPEISNYINTGMYYINPEFIEWIPKGEPFNMTDLVSLLLHESKKVGLFPISEGSFLDIGEFAEMKKVEERIKAGLIG